MTAIRWRCRQCELVFVADDDQRNVDDRRRLRQPFVFGSGPTTLSKKSTTAMLWSSSTAMLWSSSLLDWGEQEGVSYATSITRPDNLSRIINRVASTSSQPLSTGTNTLRSVMIPPRMTKACCAPVPGAADPTALPVLLIADTPLDVPPKVPRSTMTPFVHLTGC